MLAQGRQEIIKGYKGVRVPVHYSTVLYILFNTALALRSSTHTVFPKQSWGTEVKLVGPKKKKLNLIWNSGSGWEVVYLE